MAAEAKALLSSHGIDLEGAQATKTRTALEFFSAELQAAAREHRAPPARGIAGRRSTCKRTPAPPNQMGMTQIAGLLAANESYAAAAPTSPTPARDAAWPWSRAWTPASTCSLCSACISVKRMSSATPGAG